MQKRVFLTVLMAFFALASMAERLTYLSTEDFKKKVTMKVGGKYKKINNADRITREKQFKCGGRKKYQDESISNSTLKNKINISGTNLISFPEIRKVKNEFLLKTITSDYKDNQR